MYKYKVGEMVRYGYWRCEPIVCDKCGHETFLGVEGEYIEKRGKITERRRDYGISFPDNTCTFTKEVLPDGTTLNTPVFAPLKQAEKESWYKIDGRTVHEENINDKAR